MSDFQIEIVAQVTDRDMIDDSFFRAVADALFDLDRIQDHDLSAEGNLLTFGMSVSAPNEVDGLVVAMAAVRTALHAAGGSTPGWEDDIAMLRTVIEREQVVPA